MPAPVPAASLSVALGQFDVGWHEPAQALDRMAGVVREAASKGASLVVLPETSTTGFTMQAREWAEPLDGPSSRCLAGLAAEHDVWILAGLAARASGAADGGAIHNVAALYDPSGGIHASYRKQRLFSHAGEHEVYSPGHSPLIVEIEGLRVSPFICYDLRFPELFRAIASEVDAIVVIANWPAARRAHWDVLVRARAIENQCYVVAVNRTGDGGGVAYDGGSVVYDPWGERVAAAGDSPATVLGRLDAGVVADVRARYPFLPSPPLVSLACDS